MGLLWPCGCDYDGVDGDDRDLAVGEGVDCDCVAEGGSEAEADGNCGQGVN